MTKCKKEKNGNISIKLASQIMNKDPQFIRVGLQQGKLPFGYALKVNGSSHYSYYISPKLFEKYTGYKKDDEDNTSD